MVITCISVNALFIIKISFKQWNSESLKKHNVMAGQGTQPPASPVTALLRGAREPEGGALSSQPAEGARGLWKGCRHPAGRTFMKTNSLGRIRRGLSNSDKVGSLKGKLTNLNGCVLFPIHLLCNSIWAPTSHGLPHL